ncbi:D-alanyl-D-alanine carboxypeptidase family protein [Thalassobacillus sp. CUG 92003]|uniref:D-alanyl-D-alanine carboxypeptidase family protein n=1 Tax=Thalassobacillus sp. CUG 92003 TaxID=2736641 RepID=UPI0015E6E698|nr:D-alanyl-D-alanine carboxypeptidase family protein [Thalassobacillus sp. CUG 92003]
MMRKWLTSSFLVVLSTVLISCQGNADESASADNTDDNEEEKIEKAEDEENKEESSSDNQSDTSSEEEDENKEEKSLPDGTLQQGDQKKAVETVEQALKKLGYDHLTVDQSYEKETATAIRDFQAQQRDLVNDGIYGPDTKRYMQMALNNNLTFEPGSGKLKEPEENEQQENQNDDSDERNDSNEQSDERTQHNSNNESDQNKSDDKSKQSNSGNNNDQDGSSDDSNQNDSNSGSDQNNSTPVVSNPSKLLVLVNKNSKLPGDYVPQPLVTPDVRFPFEEDLPKKLMRPVAANALEKLFAAGDQAGLNLYALSGYRSYDRQEAIFASNVERYGSEEKANEVSAHAGESEHQTGLTMDVTSPKVDFGLTVEFGQTKEGQWLKQHASDYGFIIRYPKGKKNITGYQYEPWHLRYVGKEAAQAIDSQGITLEKYLGAI